jgi:hypothetical protein
MTTAARRVWVMAGAITYDVEIVVCERAHLVARMMNGKAHNDAVLKSRRGQTA